ncbi:MAG: hypothetical protein ALAOOOJD_00348 [bacterium]|nr:hypothetical protein [bacterium]
MQQVRPVILAAQFTLCLTFQVFLTLPLLAGENFAPDSSTTTLAVLDFKNNSGLFSLDGLEKSLPEMLKTELTRVQSPLLVVERQKLEMILQEQALGQTGALDEKTAQTVGQLVGAQFLLTGEISTTGARLRIDCHILKVATGQVRSEKVIGPGPEAIEAMANLLASNIKFNLIGEGTHRSNLRLKKYPTTWLAAATVLASAATGVAQGISHNAYKDYQSASRLADIEKQYNRAENFRKARNGFAVASGVFAMMSLNFWLKSRAGENTILATTESSTLPSIQLFAGCTPSGEIGLRWRWQF